MLPRLGIEQSIKTSQPPVSLLFWSCTETLRKFCMTTDVRTWLPHHRFASKQE
jgi:hypothetical protein